MKLQSNSPRRNDSYGRQNNAQVQREGFGEGQASNPNACQPPTSCVTLAKKLNSPTPEYPHLQKGENKPFGFNFTLNDIPSILKYMPMY